MKRNITIAFISLSVWICTACDKCKDIACFTPPTDFVFKIVDKNNQNISSSFSEFTLKYSKNGTTKEEKLSKIITASQQAAFRAVNLGWESTEEGVLADVVLDGNVRGKLFCKMAKKNEDCCSFFELEKLTFNEQAISNSKDQEYSYLLLVP